jgi:two-component system phosphate regulon response regulator PhoB
LARVLLVDSDPSVRATLRSVLEPAGHVVGEYEEGKTALDAVRSEPPDAVLSEVDLPDQPPFELLRELATATATRVVVVSARAAEIDRVVAFELGVDDYVTKPFSAREVVLRVAAVLRRTDGEMTQRFGPLAIDRAAARVSIDGNAISLTRTELALLVNLVDAAGGARTRAQLVNDLFGGDESRAGERAIDSHVKRLRAKLGPLQNIVETVKGVGYRFGGVQER